MKRWGITAGHRVGIVGFGGLGHLAAKIAKALGAEVTMFTRSEEKLADAGRFEVHAVLESNEPDMLALEELEPVNNQALALGRKSVAGSIIGSLADTQEVLDFCAKHRIGPDIELIGINQINEAFSKVESGDVRFRYVIDMASLDPAHQA